MIPVPMRGFKALASRLQLQTQMTEGHQHRNDIIQQEIRKIQVSEMKVVEFLELEYNLLIIITHQYHYKVNTRTD